MDLDYKFWHISVAAVELCSFGLMTVINFITFPCICLAGNLVVTWFPVTHSWNNLIYETILFYVSGYSQFILFIYINSVIIVIKRWMVTFKGVSVSWKMLICHFVKFIEAERNWVSWKERKLGVIVSLKVERFGRFFFCHAKW